jgi:hypothetical protein
VNVPSEYFGFLDGFRAKAYAWFIMASNRHAAYRRYTKRRQRDWNESSWSYARRHARSPLIYWALPRIILPGGLILAVLDYLGLFC